MRTGDSASPRRVRGRDALVERFVGVLEHGGAGVAICGNLGVGKSRLAEALAEAAQAEGRRSIVLRSGAASIDLPLGTFLPLLPGSLAATDEVSLLLAARQAVETWAGDQRPVLLIDDVHLTDSTSATLVNQLVTAGTVVLLATFRTREWVPDPIAQLWLGGQVQLWELDELDRVSADEVAEDMCGRPLDPLVLDRLWTLTQGNALFLHALLHPASNGGAVALEDIDRHLASSSTLVDFVEARLAGLSEPARDALVTVALSEPIGLEPLATLVDEGALIELERAEYVHVVEEGKRTEIRLAHPLYGEILRRRTSRLAARAVYRRLATAVSSLGALREDDVMRLAMWAVEGGLDVDRAVLLPAAERALEAGDVVLTERFVGSLWETHQDIEAGLTLLKAWLLGGADPERTAELVRALEGHAVDLQHRRRVMAFGLRNAMWRSGDLDEAERVLAWLEDSLPAPADRNPAETEAAAEVTAQRAFTLTYTSRLREGHELAAKVATEPRPSRVLIPAALAEINALATLGYPDAALEAVDRYASARMPDGSWVISKSFWPTLLTARIRPFMLQLRFREAETVAREAWERARTDSDPGAQSAALYTLASVMNWRGRIRTAQRMARDAWALGSSVSHRTAMRWSATLDCISTSALGDAAGAAAALARIESLSTHAVTVRDGMVWQARVFEAMVRGADGGAALIAIDGIRWARENETPLEELVLHDILARLHHAEPDLDRIAELGGRGGLMAVLADHATGLVQDDPVRLGRAAGALADAGADALASIAASYAAESAARHGDQRAARRWAGRSDALREETKDEVNRRLIPVPVVAAVPLSRREREVAELAATGMPAKEIAEKLYLSTRTVENHIARIYDKVGVRSRAELRELLGD